MCDFEICFKARTYFVGPMTCFTLPNVPAPNVSVTSYLEISCGYRVEALRLDLEWARSGSCLRGGPTSSFSRSLWSFSSLLRRRLNCSEFIFKNWVIILLWVSTASLKFSVSYILLPLESIWVSKRRSRTLRVEVPLSPQKDLYSKWNILRVCIIHLSGLSRKKTLTWRYLQRSNNRDLRQEYPWPHSRISKGYWRHGNLSSFKKVPASGSISWNRVSVSL